MYSLSGKGQVRLKPLSSEASMGPMVLRRAPSLPSLSQSTTWGSRERDRAVLAAAVYGLGGFWFLPGPGSPGSSGFLSSLYSSTFTLPLYCVTASALDIQ